MGEKVKKKYSAPSVFDLGGPNLNVVGATQIMCYTGGSPGPNANCLCGANGINTECDSGAYVASACSSGYTVASWEVCTVGTGATNCCTGSSAEMACNTGSGYTEPSACSRGRLPIG